MYLVGFCENEIFCKRKVLYGIVIKSVEMPLYSRHACQNPQYFYSTKYAKKTVYVQVRNLYLRKQTSSKVPNLIRSSEKYIYNYIKTVKCTEQHCTEQHCTEQHCKEQHCTEQHCTEQHCTEQHCTEQHCTEQHCTEQHCTFSDYVI